MEKTADQLDQNLTSDEKEELRACLFNRLYDVRVELYFTKKFGTGESKRLETERKILNQLINKINRIFIKEDAK